MSDLISRSALLEKFNDIGVQITFDLPVEEILGKDVNIDDFTMLVTDAIKAYKNMVIGVINEQPVAYNKEAVVKQLEEQSDYEPIDYDYCDMSCSGEEHFIETHKAIDIVKAGGIDG